MYSSSGRAGSCRRSCCTRRTMITSAASRASSTRATRRTGYPRHSSSRGSHIAGPHSVKRQPNFPSRWRFERATRLCRMSPRMVTFSPMSALLRSRMVSASSRACVGCSWVPSPALITGISSRPATNSGAPEALCRITMQSGFMASSVRTVSSSDSPLRRLETSACRFIVSAPRRAAAVPKLMRVRVEGSKNASATVLPRSVASFLSGCLWISWKGLDCSRKKVIRSALSGSMPSMWWRRCGTGVPGKAVRAARSGDALDEHHALLAVHLGQADFDDLGVAGLHVPADEGSLDGQLAVAAVDQHAQPDALRPAQVEETVHGGADGATSVKHVVGQDQILVVHGKGDVA